MSDLPPSTEITRHQAILLHNEAMGRADLLLWTIFRSPLDHPGKFVARPYSVRGAGPLAVHLLAEDLAGIRALVPPGLVQLDRDPGDDPVIVETWL